MAQRAALWLRVRPGMAEAYRQAHEEVWPSVLAACKRCGVGNYTIFLAGQDVFVYFEAPDVARALETLAVEPEIRRWQARMRPLLEVQLGTSEALLLEAVFHLD